jgi:hypothetical protein
MPVSATLDRARLALVTSRAVVTLEIIASCAPGSSAVVDYPPPSPIDDDARDLAIAAWHRHANGDPYEDAKNAARDLRAGRMP